MDDRRRSGTVVAVVSLSSLPYSTLSCSRHWSLSLSSSSWSSCRLRRLRRRVVLVVVVASSSSSVVVAVVVVVVAVGSIPFSCPNI